MSEPFVYIFGPETKLKPDEDRETRILKQWAHSTAKPDAEQSKLLRKRLIELEVWRQELIKQVKIASEHLVAHQNTDPLNTPSKRTEEYQAGRAQGRYEGYSEANRVLVDIINRAGLAGEVWPPTK